MFAVQSYATVKLICLMGHLIRCESRYILCTNMDRKYDSLQDSW